MRPLGTAKKKVLYLPVIALVGIFSLSLTEGSALAAMNGSGSDDSVSFDHSHALWDELLKKFVHGGSVDYAEMKKNGQNKLNAYLKDLESVRKSAYSGWTRKQKMAFGINAYNAYTIRLVLNEYPIKSLREVGASPGSAWKKRFVPLDGIWGKKLSLNGFENDILRPRFKDPRLHFALVCAAKSCPVLRGEAYTASALSKQLNQQTRRFLRNKARNRFDSGNNKMYLSKIFEWYKQDFIVSAPSVEAYAAALISEEAKAAVAAGGVEVEYLPYDWSLNNK